LRRETDRHLQQLPLLPLQVDASWPANLGTADLKHLVRTRDGHCYAVKTTDDHPLMPATEYLCYKLAAACGLSVPFSSLIELRPHVMAFGSRLEAGVHGWTALGPAAQFKAYELMAEPISATLAFDLFVGNVDRHRGNFIFRLNSQDNWV